MVEAKWGKKYPLALKSWRNNWANISVFFKYPEEIRKTIYTTNIVENVHRQFRKVTKNRSVFPNDDSLKKMLYWLTEICIKNGLSLSETGLFLYLSLLLFSKKD